MGKKDSILDFNSLDVEKEASSLISEMKDIAEYLIDPPKKDGEEEKNKSNQGKNNQQSPQQQQRNQSGKGGGQRDPQQELKDALDELQSLLDSKTDKEKQKGQQSGNDSNGEGQEGGGQSGGESSGGGGGGGALPPGVHIDPVNMSSPPNKGKVKFRGIDIDLNNLPQDLKEDKDDKNKTEKEKEYLAEEFIRQAINEFKAHSPNGGGRMLTLFEESVKPAPPKWVNILNPYLRPDNNIQWLWNKAHRNRLTMANGGKVLFRGTNRPKEKLKNLCIALDNSGSIDQEDFRKFYSVVKGFLDIRKNVQGWVCWWDADKIELDAPNQGPFKNYKEFRQVKAYGGGGTDPEVALEYAKKRDCKYVIIFTDGYFDFPNKKWESEFVKVIWVIAKKEDFENFDCKWGIKAI